MNHDEAERLRERLGGSALVTGGARGIGGAFAEALAEGGFDVLLVDREVREGQALAGRLRDQHGVDARLIACDLADPGLARLARRWIEEYDIGLLVCNAGISPMGPFLDIPLDHHLTTLEINCRATLLLSHVVGRSMVARGRGGIVIVSSASGINGAPYTANYAATKAYGLTLASGLWYELREHGVDVVAVCPGLTDTAPVKERGLDQDLPFLVPIHGPTPVARGALRALGREPLVIPTLADRVSTSLLQRLLPRRWTLALVGRSMQRLRTAKPDR